MIIPHPGKQTEIMQAVADVLLIGGARASGKSFLLGSKAALTPTHWHYEINNIEVTEDVYKNFRGKNKAVIVDKVNIDHPNFLAVLVRRTYPQLRDNLKPECDKIYKPQGAKWSELNKTYTFPSGAKIRLKHCKDVRALDNFIGGNYNFIGIDEVNQFPEDWVKRIIMSVRSGSPDGIRTQIMYTSNPGNIGHVWLKREIVDKCPPIVVGTQYSKQFDVTYEIRKTGKPYVDEEGVSIQYIPATVFDNKSILENDPNYVKRLKNLNPALRKMWLYGDWDSSEGMFFANWNPGIHVIDKEDFKYGYHFDKNTHNLYRAYDYGLKNPFVCQFIAVDRDNNSIVFDEIVETEMSASQQAKYINEYTYGKYGLTPNDFTDEIADPAYWARASEKDGVPYSYAEFYGDEKIYLSKGINNRKVGAGIVYELLTVPKTGAPKLRFTDNCEYSIETFPSLPAKLNDPEDVDTEGEDHAYDAIRYFASILYTFMDENVQEPKEQKGWRKRMAEKKEQEDNYRGSWLSV